MAVTRQGFLSTLEAVIASTIFFLFLLNAAPTFTDGGGDANEMTMDEIRSTTAALDQAGSLRDHIAERDLQALEDSIDDYLVPLNVAVGVLYTNTTEGTFSGTSSEYTFSGNGTEESATLRLWVDQADGLVVGINGQTALRTSRSGYHEEDISDLTVDGTNTINFTAVSADLDFEVEQYLYQQSQELPTDTTITSAGHHISGTNGTLDPAELRVFVWE